MRFSRIRGDQSNPGRKVWLLCQDGRVDSGPYLRGIALFNEADYFAAHEALEEVWRDAPEAQRKFLQGLIQAAVAFHHYSTRNPTGARSVLKRALHNLEKYPDDFGGLKLAPLRLSIRDWLGCFENQAEVPPLPRLQACD